MPFLRFKGFDKEMLTAFAPQLAERVSDLAGISPSKVKVELLHADFITDVPPSVEIAMFPRKQEIHDAIAQWLHERLQERGYERAHIYYVLLNPALYYKEGKPLKDYSFSAPGQEVLR